MKKFAIASMLAVAALSASAVEVGVTGSSATAGTDRQGFGVTVGQNYGVYNLTAGVERLVKTNNDQTRVTLVGSRNVYSVGPVGLSARVGAAYLNNQTGEDGSALLVGVGASVPVAKNVTAGLSVDRQYGQSRVSSFNGNIATASIKYSF